MAIRHDRKVSILDVMGPVMVGPSSSHTAGTARLGRVAREILDEDPREVHFFLHPPLALTYRGHGSDFALVGGAIGLNVDDPRIPEAIRIADAPGFALGVQWHAEFDPQRNPINRALFQAFGEAVSAHKRAA